MILGIRSRLFLISLLLVAAGLAAAELFLVPRLERERTQEVRAGLVRLAQAAGEALRAAGPAADPDLLAKRLTRSLGVRVTFIDCDGRVVGDGEVPASELAQVENHASRPEVKAALTGRTGSDARRSATVGTRFLYVATPAAAGNGLVARAAAPLVEVERTLARLRRSLVLGAGLGLLVAAALSTIAAHIVAGPLREMTAVAQGLAERRFAPRLYIDSRDELGSLAGALNRLSADLERTLTDLVHERDLLGSVLNGMADGVLVTDAKGGILRANPALEQKLGLEGAAAAGSSATGEARTVLEATRSPALARHTAEVLARQAALTAEIEFPGPPASVFLLSSAPLSQRQGVVSVVHDVTELRRLERVRRDFVANVSHELRTPVAALQAAGETLLAGALDDPPRAREFTGIIARNAERLGQLVSDLLALAKIEAGKLDLRLEPVAVRPLVERAIETLSATLAEKRIEAVVAVDAGVRVHADARALEQVLANLLDNAAKYTPAGGRVGVEAALVGGEHRLTVWDTGPGLDPAQRKRVFERFYRVDSGRSRATGGTGLGLSIAKHLVESMGGRIGVDEREGGGSRFWIAFGH